MYAVKHSSIRTSFVLVVVTLLFMPMALFAGKPVIHVDLGGNGLSFSADAGLYVRIGGPNDYFEELRGDGYLQWAPVYGLPDGTYRYDCYASANEPPDESSDESLGEQGREAAAKASSSRIHGVFLIDNGIVIEKETGAPTEPKAGQGAPDPMVMQGQSDESGYARVIREAIGGALNFLVPEAQAEDVINDDLRVNGYLKVKLPEPSFNSLDYDPSVGDMILDGGALYLKSHDPRLHFQDYSGTDQTWQIWVYGSSFSIMDTVGSNNNIPFQIDTQTGSNVHNSIFVNSLGDVSFANQGVYIDKSKNSIGVGTTTPGGSLHIIDSNWPELILQDTGTGARIWELEATDDEIRIRGEHPTSGAASYPFTVYNDAEDHAIVVGKPTSSSRNVGIGTYDPETGLHVWRGDGNGIVKIEENNAITAQRFQVQLENNGGTGFKFTDTSVANREWQNAMLSNGDFAFSFIGTGGAEVQVKPSGEVRMGPGPTINFQLKTNGDLSIPNGKVVATAFQQSSSRSVKQAFSPIDEAEVLDKLLALEISEWEYRDPSVGGRHLGPTAEEFHAAYGFGTSDKHIYPADMAGVSLVAARQLQRRSVIRDAEIAELRRQNAELKVANGALEHRLAHLEMLVADIASHTSTE